MTIVKLVLVLASVFAQHYALTAPNPQPPKEQLRELRDAQSLLLHVPTLLKTFASAWALFQIAVLVASSGFCPRILSHLILAVLPDLTAFNTLSPAFLAGTCITLASCILRAHCYRALGLHFVFQLAIRPAHTLVTHGAYGLVRHPSNTASIFLVAGWLLCLLDLRALVHDDHVLGVWVGLDCRATMTAVWVCVSAMSLGSLCMMLKNGMDKEDAMLEKHFGKEWQAWAKRVPCRLIPGVY